MKKLLLTVLFSLTVTASSANDFVSDIENLVGVGPEVNINLGTGLINTILAFADEDEDAKKAAAALTGLDKLKISVFDISNNKNTQQLTDLIKDKIEDLNAQGYEPIITVKEDDEMVHIIAKVNGDSLENVMIVVMEDNDELVVLSMDGEVNVKQLAQLSHQFDMDLGDIFDI
ncbi:MAG: DUF4252 domain-containing protein [Marinicellaceae bacterium]